MPVPKLVAKKLKSIKGQTAQELGLQNGKLVNIDFSDDLKEIRSVQILQNLHSFY
jgi:hypothetical protein